MLFPIRSLRPQPVRLLERVGRREALGPTSLGQRARKRQPLVTGTCRGARRCRCTVKGVSQTPKAPPGAPSPRRGNGRKGHGAPRAKQPGRRSVG